MPDIEFSDLSPTAGETVKFPPPAAPVAPPKVSTSTLGADPYNDLVMGRTPQAVNIPTSPTGGVSPQLQADFKTLVEFMNSQRQQATGSAPPGSAAAIRESLIDRAKAQDISIPKPPPGTATSNVGQPQQFTNLPNATKAAVLGALGRLLTAGAARLASGVAGAVVPATPANAQEQADLAAKGLGTGAQRVQMKDWDKEAVKSAEQPKPIEPPKPAEAAPEKPAAETPKSSAPKPPRDKDSFERAFAAARKAKGPGKTFTWNGKTYTTDLASEVKRKGPKALIPADNSADDLNAKELARIRGQR